MSMKLLGIISVGSVVTDLLWIRSSTFGRYWRKSGSIIGYSVKGEVLYNILLEFGIPKKVG
jgi:hypothetical protein